MNFCSDKISDCPSAKSSCLRTRLEVKERCIMQLMVELSSSIADLKAVKVENKRLREYANSFKTLTDALRDYEESFLPNNNNIRHKKRRRSVRTQCECECERD